MLLTDLRSGAGGANDVNRACESSGFLGAGNSEGASFLPRFPAGGGSGDGDAGAQQQCTCTSMYMSM